MISQIEVSWLLRGKPAEYWHSLIDRNLSWYLQQVALLPGGQNCTCMLGLNSAFTKHGLQHFLRYLSLVKCLKRNIFYSFINVTQHDSFSILPPEQRHLVVMPKNVIEELST